MLTTAPRYIFKDTFCDHFPEKMGFGRGMRLIILLVARLIQLIFYHQNSKEILHGNVLLISRLKFKKIFSQRHNQLKCFCQIIVRSTIKVLRIFETQTTITILQILHELYITWVSPKHKDLSRDLMSRTAAQKTSALFEHTYYTQTPTKWPYTAHRAVVRSASSY